MFIYIILDLCIIQINIYVPRPIVLKIIPLFLNSSKFKIGRVQIKIGLLTISGKISLYKS
jgi:hypothetical protein